MDFQNRMMNTSGVKFKDHAGSMVRLLSTVLNSHTCLFSWKDLCRAALEFSFVVLKAGGHFICKFYQGAEDRALEKQLKCLFEKVHRLKPESSRNVRAILYILPEQLPCTDLINRHRKRRFLLASTASNAQQKTKYSHHLENRGGK